MCGIFAVVNVRKAAEFTVVGLHCNQHRAREFAGIVSTDGTHLYRKSGAGIAHDVFGDIRTLNELHGRSSIGHIRYSTVEDREENRDNTQPICGHYDGKEIAIAHNGNLTNTEELARRFPDIKLKTSMDSEYILRLLELTDTGDIVADLKDVLANVKGSYVLALLTPSQVIVVRDPTGNRPVSYAKLTDGYVISSEDCAFPVVEAEHVADFDSGTITVFSDEGVETSRYVSANVRERRCCFEHIYYGHPTSRIFGVEVKPFRRKLGRMLEQTAPASVDIVVPIPDSANYIAEGYAESGDSGVLARAIERHHNTQRSFIAASAVLRDLEAGRKFMYNRYDIEGQDIVLIDDSIVRGNTLPRIVAKLRLLGAKSVHVRIGSPPTKYPCRYGINTPTHAELIASEKTLEELCTFIGADSLEYLSLEALKEVYGAEEAGKYCFACMDGKYW